MQTGKADPYVCAWAGAAKIAAIDRTIQANPRIRASFERSRPLKLPETPRRCIKFRMLKSGT